MYARPSECVRGLVATTHVRVKGRGVDQGSVATSPFCRPKSNTQVGQLEASYWVLLCCWQLGAQCLCSGFLAHAVLRLFWHTHTRIFHITCHSHTPFHTHHTTPYCHTAHLPPSTTHTRAPYVLQHICTDEHAHSCTRTPTLTTRHHDHTNTPHHHIHNPVLVPHALIAATTIQSGPCPSGP
jgi:hypothetical protein